VVTQPDASHQNHVTLRAAVRPFEQPSGFLACWQLFSSAGFYIATLGVMYWSLHISYWLTLLLAFPASSFLVRTFIVQHDCGHGSFLGSPRMNNIVGTMCGFLTFAPYQNWRRQHSQHHANWNNLDRRQHGADIYSACLTTDEYRALSGWRQLLYRLPRHPLLAHVVFPPLVFLLLYRLPFDTPKQWRAERRSVWITNVAIGLCALLLGLWVGFGALALVQLPVITITTIVGVWLFSIQHRFETARWLRKNEWSFQAAALTGSSHLKLPRWLQWATGNIGFHHIHHLAPGVPNYRLEDCHSGSAILRGQAPLTIRTALRAVLLTLWDERTNRLVRFADV
jgi:acyl-lipid omega-6 desaturase (Delta-12 desaturase)